MSKTRFLDLTHQVLEDNELDPSQIKRCIDFLADPQVDDLAKEEFLEAMSSKGESQEEFSTFVTEFRNRAIDPGLENFADKAIDLCGTGGDRAHSFNVSTFVSFMVASAEVPVIKHGNRSISSKCGSADLIEAIGIPIISEPKQIQEGLKKLHFCFLFAPQFHPSFKYIAPVRKKLAQKGIVTFFNVIGPMINPAKPSYQLVGTYDPNYLQSMAAALESNGLKSGLIVHCKVNDEEVDAVDELTSCGENIVCGVGKNQTDGPEIWPLEKWQQERHPPKHLQGGDLARNLEIMNQIMKKTCPPGLLSTILINAATAFQICGKTNSLGEGIELSEKLLEDGTVRKWIDQASSFFAK